MKDTKGGDNNVHDGDEIIACCDDGLCRRQLTLILANRGYIPGCE